MQTNDFPRTDDDNENSFSDVMREEPLTLLRSLNESLFRATLGRFASGVVVVAASTVWGPVAMTCQSFFSVSLEPALIAISPSLKSTSWPRIAGVGEFAISVLGRDQEAVCRSFAVSGGNKFAGVDWSLSSKTGSPLIAGSLAWLDCRLHAVYPGGDHYLAVAEVVGLLVGEGSPLLFYQGEFGTFQG
jgi:3-hydroxy-9,10-secoandrosta-1,3,5(10)-triene-9,17-dione monooxygenase reductase component